MPEARLNLYFSPIKPTLYMSKSSIFSVYGSNQKYIKATLSNDATNNSAIVKYDDTNYFPESFIFYCVDVANNSYMFVIITKKDRTISSDNALFLCFPVTLNRNANTSTLSDYLNAISGDTSKSIKLELSEVMKNDANGYFTGFEYSYVYVNNDTITVSADPALLAGLTDKLKLDNLYGFINSDRTNKSVNAILKQSELQSIMDCQAVTGDDSTDMINVNVNSTINREQLMSNTIVMILMFGGIVLVIISIFDNLMYTLFSIIDFLHKYKYTVLKNDGNEYLLGLCSLLFGYLFISTATFMLVFSVIANEGSFLWGAVILYGLFALLYSLYKGRNGDFMVNNNKISVNEEIMKGLIGLFWKDGSIQKTSSAIFVLYLAALGTTLGFMFSDEAIDDYNSRKKAVITCLVLSCILFLMFIFV